MTDQPRLPAPDGYCWRCGGSGRVPASVVVARGRRRGPLGGDSRSPTRPPPEHEFECLELESACPDCRPASTARDRWLAAARIGREGP